jgi:hypothetical protein
MSRKTKDKRWTSELKEKMNDEDDDEKENKMEEIIAVDNGKK